MVGVKDRIDCLGSGLVTPGFLNRLKIFKFDVWNPKSTVQSGMKRVGSFQAINKALAGVLIRFLPR